jgi:enamine deaminase RidA (YjgF/YER057c/UK114 family)
MEMAHTLAVAENTVKNSCAAHLAQAQPNFTGAGRGVCSVRPAALANTGAYGRAGNSGQTAAGLSRLWQVGGRFRYQVTGQLGIAQAFHQQQDQTRQHQRRLSLAHIGQALAQLGVDRVTFVVGHHAAWSS